jgi:hypothetical protein
MKKEGFKAVCRLSQERMTVHLTQHGALMSLWLRSCWIPNQNTCFEQMTLVDNLIGTQCPKLTPRSQFKVRANFQLVAT